MRLEPLTGRKKRQLAEKSQTIEQAENSLKQPKIKSLIEVGDKFRRFTANPTGRCDRTSQFRTPSEAWRVTQGRYNFELLC